MLQNWMTFTLLLNRVGLNLKKKIVILQSIEIIAINKSNETRAVIYIHLQIFYWTFLIPICNSANRLN